MAGVKAGLLLCLALIVINTDSGSICDTWKDHQKFSKTQNQFDGLYFTDSAHIYSQHWKLQRAIL